MHGQVIRTSTITQSILTLCIIIYAGSGSAIADDKDHWQFTLTPVLWNASVSATLSDDDSGGDLPIEPDYRFFTLDNLDDYLSLKFEASHGRWGILFDSLRARYQDETSNKLANFIVATDLGFIEASASYQLTENQHLDLIIGVRHSFLDIDQTILITTQPSMTTSYDFDWTDPLIGLRYQLPVSPNWLLLFRGDIGGFDVATQRMINVTAEAHYMINTHFSFIMGYRYLQIDFKEDDVLYDVTLDGVHIGLGIHF